jgi:hypothetical protein
MTTLMRAVAAVAERYGLTILIWVEIRTFRRCRSGSTSDNHAAMSAILAEKL